MADRQNAAIEIYGHFPDIESIVQVASAMVEDQAGSTYEGGQFMDAEEAVRTIAGQLATGNPVTAARYDTADQLVSTSETCRALGLAYQISLDASQNLPEASINWAPGFESPFHVNTQDMVPMISLDTLAAAKRKGADELMRVVDDRILKSFANQPRTASADLDVVEAATEWEMPTQKAMPSSVPLPRP